MYDIPGISATWHIIVLHFHLLKMIYQNRRRKWSCKSFELLVMVLNKLFPSYSLIPTNYCWFPLNTQWCRYQRLYPHCFRSAKKQEEKPGTNFYTKKFVIMKSESILQEILLITTTTFSKRQLCETDRKGKKSILSPVQQMATACWNSLLDELLPEIMLPPMPNKKLFLWQVEKRKFSFSVIKANCHPDQDEWFSLDPHLFLCRQEMN